MNDWRKKTKQFLEKLFHCLVEQKQEWLKDMGGKMNLNFLY